MHTFATPTTISLSVDVPVGRIQVIATDRTDTTVEVRPSNSSSGRDAKAVERTTVELHDGALRVATPTVNELFGPSGSVEATVQLPAGSRVEVTGCGELRGVGRLGDVVATDSYGAIKLDEAASVRLATQAGDVSVGRLAGTGEISTAKGDIRVEEAVSGALVLSTQMGDVSVAAAAGVSASLDAGTSLGRVTNALRNDGAAELEIRATTSYGDITARSL
ncbi:DUF4097 family beta strand repeat-containing protein [Cellulosimicrobium sp. CUA-896]|uniref:DUF4097 family beta strand repeat-containing protein n=1 Tax=Cellulosimicrobium sp. CUA-896 TaxID=1517881 RepID=UPI00095BD20F|nr:DUF4097 family beta strand repeat-containing protein [Cellulosimicrobium sp. CUA-896]OLT51734.1 hypothetical protein BJF88_14650 [Cellulosimicrobium sp. CUA-896]